LAAAALLADTGGVLKQKLTGIKIMVAQVLYSILLPIMPQLIVAQVQAPQLIQTLRGITVAVVLVR
jgi:hypothetical protein